MNDPNRAVSELIPWLTAIGLLRPLFKWPSLMQLACSGRSAEVATSCSSTSMTSSRLDHA